MMKRYVSILSMICVFAFAGIARAVAQAANPASDFEYDLTADGDGVVIQKYKGTATDVVIPAVIEDFPVVEVASEVFQETNVVSVVFPDSVSKIGSSCFEKCKALQKVVLPKNLKTIARDLFEYCTALKTITLPDSIEGIHEGAFKNSGLESLTIPDSVNCIINWAFANCENLRTVTIGNGTEFIGKSSFFDCPNLTTVTIGSGIQSIGDNAFKSCSSLTTVNIGEGNFKSDFNIEVYGSYYKTGYGENVFSGCSSLGLKEKQKLRKTGYTGRF